MPRRKTGAAVEQQRGAPGLDRPKADRVDHGLVARGQFDPVAARVLRAPALEPLRHAQPERTATARVGPDRLSKPQLRQPERHGQRALRAVELHPACKKRRIRRIELHEIVAHERAGRFHQQHAPRQPAIVPPVHVVGGDALGAATVVHIDDQIVFAVADKLRDFKIERGKTALVAAQHLTVEGHDGFVVGRAEVEKQPPIGWQVVGEGALVPDGALVEEKFGALAVPVAGHFQARGVFEAVLDAIGRMLRAAVAEKPVGVGRVAVGAVAHVKRIDDDGPASVQRGGPAAVHVDDERIGLGLSASGQPAQQKQQQVAAHGFDVGKDFYSGSCRSLRNFAKGINVPVNAVARAAGRRRAARAGCR